MMTGINEFIIPDDDDTRELLSVLTITPTMMGLMGLMLPHSSSLSVITVLETIITAMLTGIMLGYTISVIWCHGSITALKRISMISIPILIIMGMLLHGVGIPGFIMAITGTIIFTLGQWLLLS